MLKPLNERVIWSPINLLLYWLLIKKMDPGFIETGLDV